MPLAFIARSAFAVLVEARLPIRSMDDLIARSKAAPGKLSLGNEGPRTFSGLIARRLNARSLAGANLVAYSSVGTGTQDLIGGPVDAMVADLPATAQGVKQGRLRLRLLATTAARRVPGWEAVPALAERIALIGLLVEAGLGPDQVAAFLRSEPAQWAASAKEIGRLPA